ncbi:MAG: hypothetical protein H6654_16595 [Ardenticatenaceae bacterium]|nr:hypothetical protein [Anaerolineales bacterium]MCB8939736.1 hypothetical protein [Ardenticatenaceae bacterium]MCB8975180.1 hypothetical protein [Ardenticatenaceae bacterium]
MTTFIQFCAGAKLRHDFSDQIQVRYPHPSGEDFDTWISGEEVMSRLKTMSREQLIHSFSRMNWPEAKAALQRELDGGQQKAQRSLKERLAGLVEDNIGGNIFGDTLADNIRGVDSSADPHAQEKALWQQRLHHDAFRAIALELAWINLEGTFPDEPTAEPDDWV